MKKSFYLLTLISLLSGCAVATKTYSPDGREAYVIDCSGTGGTWGMCMSKAGKLCGSLGYDIITTAGDKNAIFSAQPQFGMGLTTTSRNILISCKNTKF